MARVERIGSIDVVRSPGTLRDEALEELQSTCQQLLRHGFPSIIIDLTQTVVISGLGLQWLLQLDRDCSQLGGVVVVAGAHDLAAEALSITGVGPQLQLAPDMMTALARFAS